MNISLTKFNFQSLQPKFRIWFFYLTILDFIILSIYLMLFQINKSVYFGSDSINTINTLSPKYLDITNCLCIITIKRNDQIYINENYLNLDQFKNYVKGLKKKKKSFVVILCDHNANLNSLFHVMDTLNNFNIPDIISNEH